MLISIILSLCACGQVAPLEAPLNEWTVTDGITLHLLQDAYPVGVKSMTLILENSSEKVMLYGEGWYFEKKTGDTWIEAKLKDDIAFHQLGYTLEAHDRKTMIILTSILEETLSPGLYRVTGMGPLSVADNPEELHAGGEKTDFPPYQLEFTVTYGAADEPAASPLP